MRVIIWKELREHGAWSIRAIILIGLLVAAANLMPEPPPGNIPLDHFLYNGLLAWTIGAAILGIALGGLQVGAERKRDTWAFYIHRPVSQAALFFGKVIAGLLIYLVGVGVPFLVELVWLSIPGHIARPFTPSAALPGLIDILFGVVAYFIAMQTAMWGQAQNSKRLMGGYSRYIGVVGFAVLIGATANATYTIPQYWLTLLLLSVLGGLSLIAAYGDFAVSGEYTLLPRLMRFCQSATLYVGLLAAVWAFFIIQPSKLDPRQLTTARYYNYLDQNGHIFQSMWQDSANVGIPAKDGQPIPNAPAVNTSDRTKYLFTYPLFGQTHEDYTYRGDQYYFIRLSYSNDVAWYYSFATGRINAYYIHNRQLIGTLGPDGFSHRTTGPRFEETWADLYNQGNSRSTGWGYLMKDAHAIYWFMPSSFRVTRVAAVPQSEHVLGVGTLYDSSHPYNYRATPPIFYITDQYIRAVTWDGKLLLSTPTSFPVSAKPTPGHFSYVEVGISETNPHYFFIYHVKSHPFHSARPGPAEIDRIVETDANGRVLSQRAIPPTNVEIDYSRKQAKWTSVLVPPAAVLGLSLIGHVFPNSSVQGFVEQYAVFAASWVMSLIAGIIAALLAYLIGGRYGWEKNGRLSWACAIFLLGLPGVLMLFALQPLPPREICAVCGKKRVVTRELCEHCGAPFPAEARNGTEIFDEVAV